VAELSESAYVEAETTRRIAENEARFRAANERVEEAWTRLGASEQTLPFVCECGRTDCLLVLRLTVDQYEQGRRNPRLFLCAPGHEITGDDIGRVVQRESSFVIVEKLGEAGTIAERADPRRDGHH
jgi:hypothetical protein